MGLATPSSFTRNTGPSIEDNHLQAERFNGSSPAPLSRSRRERLLKFADAFHSGPEIPDPNLSVIASDEKLAAVRQKRCGSDALIKAPECGSVFP